MARSRLSRPIVIVSVVVVLATIGVVIWLLVDDGVQPDGDGQRPRVENPVRLIEQKNVALGLLENQKPADAVPVFEEITEKVPNDPLGPRNLAVSALLALKFIDRAGEPQVHSTALARAETALQKLRDVAAEDAIVHVLTSRVAVEKNQPQRAIEELVAATKRQPDEAWIWFELSQRALESEDPQTRELGEQALQKAFELRPDNLFVLVQWLRHVASRLNERTAQLRRADEQQKPEISQAIARDFGDLAERLQTARQTIQPFAASIREFTRVDVLQLLDQAIAAVEGGQWETVSPRLSTLANVLVRESAVDRGRVDLHPLEFVLLNFRPEFYEEVDLQVEAAPPIPVQFVPARPEEWLPAALQEPLSGIAHVELADFDLDGRTDLFVLTDNAIRVFGRTAGDGPWQVLAEAEVPAGMTGLLVADLDLDFEETEAAAAAAQNAPVEAPCLSADVDLVVYGTAGVRILQNKFDGQAQQRTLAPVAETGLGEVGNVLAGAVVDLDAEGDLDLALSTAEGISLWSNRGNFTFLNISDRSQLPPADFHAQALLPVDWDRDVDLDLIVAGRGGVGVLENLRHGRLRWRPFADEFEAPDSASALALVDADANGSWDVLAGGEQGITLIRTRTPQPGVVRHLASSQISGAPVESMTTWDYDNDGFLDVLAWNEQTVQVFRGLADAKFEPVEGLIPSPPQPVRSAATGDIDRDGDLDLVIAGPDQPALFRNEGGNQNHWIDVALLGQQIKGADPAASGRVTAHGLGSLLELKTGARYQPQVVTGQTTHFGLGGKEQADVIRVLWLNGIPQNILQPRADLFICEQQILHTSCPYLYTWNGEEFVFATDLLWASPLGLQSAEGELLPFREWEYIKIPAEKLVSKNGEYVLQVTEELWEATYFDEIRLIAVDHPAEVDIYSNEKVGPARIAEFKVHTVANPRTPISAVNHRGRDILPEIARADGVYLKAFDRKLRQGLVEEHFLELDLGDLEDPDSVTLFLTGWVYPAAVSINVALSQNPDLPLPRPPSLWVPDGNGGWKEALPYMGFPGGKTKTIAVDLSGLFETGDYRVRIATSMELYWDQIFFTADEPAAEFRLTDLKLLGADLHARGYSRVIPDPGFGPEQFLYNDVTTDPKWPPMGGRFTRFGDVTELIRDGDDRLLVTGAGDEMTVRFAVPDEPLPRGWKRDFLLYSVGWDKDCNLNTVLGQTVEPLPFRGMSAYPWPPDEKTPDSPEYREYLRTYQTREQGAEFWRFIREYDARDSARESRE